MQTESSCRRSLAGSLCGWISFCVILVAAGIAVSAVSLQKRAILAALHEQAQTLAEDLSGDPVRTAVWNLDGAAAQRYLDRTPFDRDAVFVRVLNQFGEVLAERSFDGGRDAIRERREVRYANETIGFVEVGFSSRESDQVVRALVVYALVFVVCGATAMAVIVWVAVHVLVRKPLRRMVEKLKFIADGNFDQRLPRSAYREIDEINGEVNTMGQIISLQTRQLEAEVIERRGAEAEVRALAVNLEAQVTARTAELTQTNRRLTEEIRERRQAQDEILAISAYEQRRIGIDLHDSLGQELTGASFLTDALAKALRRASSDLAVRAEQVTLILSNAVAETRRIARGLTPVETSGGGLGGALRGLCHNTSERFGVDCRFAESGAETCTSGKAADFVFRIAQEAVNNAIRHGQARRVTVALHEDEQSGIGRLTVMDDGSGIPEEQGLSSGMGMRTMRYRAEALRGRLGVSSNASGGSTVAVEYALHEQPHPGPRLPDPPTNAHAGKG